MPFRLIRALLLAALVASPALAADPFDGVAPGFGTPVYTRSFAITAGVALSGPTRAIFVPPGGGSLTLTTKDDGNSATLVFGSAWPGGFIFVRASAVSAWTGPAGLIGFQ